MSEKLKDKIVRLIDISRFVGRNDITEKLVHLENALDRGKYMLTFMGQFSSGKSSLINELLGRDILPVHVMETTAAITCIEYGEDTAVLEYRDGRTEKCSIERVKGIWNEEAKELLERLECIHIMLDSPLLSDGLIITDTPGINTTLMPHVKLTTDIIRASNGVVYVMQKSLTGTDKELLKILNNEGISIIPARTHMDNLNQYEEDIDQTLEQERESLREYTDIPAFFTSDKADNKFYDGMADLRNYIRNTFADDTQLLIERSASRTCVHASQKLAENIEFRIKLLSEDIQSKESILEKERTEAEEELELLGSSLSRKTERLRKDYAAIKSSAADEIKERINGLSKKGQAEIEELEANELNAERIKLIIADKCCRLRTAYISNFERILKDSKDQFINDFGDRYEFSDMPDTLDGIDDSMEAIKHRIEGLYAMQQLLEDEIKQSYQKIENSNAAIDQINSETSEYMASLENIQQELSDYGPYIERYKIREGTHDKEKALGAVGFVADIATLFINPESWANILGKAGKALKLTDTAGKATKTLVAADKAMDIAKVSEKVINTAKTVIDPRLVDKVINTGKQVKAGVKQTGRKVAEGIGALRQMHLGGADNINRGPEEASYRQMYEKIKEKEPGILDYISIQYWMERLGRSLDKPDKVELDLEYKKSYDEGHDRIMAKYQKIIDDSIQKKKQANLIRNDIEEEKERTAQNLKHRQKIDSEIKELRERLDKEMAEAKNTKRREYYASKVRETLDDCGKYLLDTVQPEIDGKFEDYLEIYSLEYHRNAESIQRVITQVQEKYDMMNADEQAVELEKCKDQMMYLREVIENGCI